MKIKFWLWCIFVVVASSCQPTSLDDEFNNTNMPTPLPSWTDQLETATIALSPAPVPQAVPENHSTNEFDPLWDNGQMPVFMEVIQTTKFDNNTPQGPTFHVNPIMYFYEPDAKVLMLNPTITLEPKTEVLVGVAEILETPKQVFENRVIFQFPSAQPALLEILALDDESHKLTIQVGSEMFELSPGESRTFKQFGRSVNDSTVVTVISNHGSLSDIKLITIDGSQR